MKCAIEIPAYLTRDQNYPILDRFYTMTGWWYVVKCDDNTVRHFHETVFGGKPSPHRGLWWGFQGVDRMMEKFQ